MWMTSSAASTSYRDALGFEVTGSLGEEGELFWVRLERASMAVMISLGFVRILGAGRGEVSDRALHQEGRRNDRGRTRDREGHEYLNTATYLYVDDADRAFERVKAAGYQTINTPEDRPYGLREFLVGDPDGYVFAVAHRLPSDPGG